MDYMYAKITRFMKEIQAVVLFIMHNYYKKNLTLNVGH